MIGSLRGTVIDRLVTEVTIEVSGVGYRVTVTPTTVGVLTEAGRSEVFLFTSQVFRETDQELFGFPTRDERMCFESLRGVHGVGPALALAILGVHTPSALRSALAEDDLDALCLVPGVGKKTAAKLLIDLKAKLADISLDADTIDIAANAVSGRSGQGSKPSSGKSEVREALSALGYLPDEIRLATADLPADSDTSALLRMALQRLAR
jgi:Holliday junction DNA helicase RuvA